MDFHNDDITMNMLVEAGSSVSGNLFSAGMTRINGDIDGRIESVGKLFVGAKARVRADIIAKSAVIGGVVEGDIFAPEGVHVESNAIVLGDIVTKRVQIDKNVIFQGRCIAIKDEENFQNAKKRWVDIKAVHGKIFSVHN